MSGQSRSAGRQGTVTAARLVWIVVVVGLVIAATRANPGWDVLAYAGVARSIAGESDPATIQRQAYGDVRRSVTPEVYDALVGVADGGYNNSQAYRQAVANDPMAFSQQLPFYRVKPLYPLLMLAMSATGMSLTVAAELISAMSYGALLLIVFAWLWDPRHPWWTVLIAGALGVSPPLLSVARFTTPDALCAALTVGSLFLVFHAGRTPAGIALFFVAALARVNILVILALLVVYLGFVARSHLAIPRRGAALILGGILAFYVGLTTLSGSYPFATLFYASMVAFLPYPAAGAPSLSELEYLRLYWSSLMEAVVSLAPAYAAMGVLALRLRLRPAGRVSIRADPLVGLVLILFAAATIQWLYMPHEVDRILAPTYVGMVVVLAWAAVETPRLARLSDVPVPPGIPGPTSRRTEEPTGRRAG